MKNKYYVFIILGQIIYFTSCHEKKVYGQQQLVDKIEFTTFENFMNNSASEFHNDTLKLRGHLSVYFEDVSIKIGNEKIWISNFEPAIDEMQAFKLTNRDVIIIGLYNSKESGHNLGFRGGFKEVYYIKLE